MPTERVIKAQNPEEVRLVTVADPHLAGYSPPSWKADYPQITAAAVDQVLGFAQKERADAVVWAGDVFHTKAAARNPTAFVTRCMQLLRRGGLLHVGIAGNHDLKWGSLKGLEGLPLSLLTESGLYQLLDEQELVIQANGFSVRVAGASYEHGRAEGCKGKLKNGATWLVSVGHFWFGTECGTLQGEPIFNKEFFQGGAPDVYVIGHKHDDQGIQTEGGKTFVVPGSISLTGEKLGDATRRPAAGYIKLTAKAVQASVLRPKVPPTEQLLDTEKRQQVIAEARALEEFVTTLAQTTLEAQDPRKVLKTMELSEDVRQRVEFYLKEAEAALAKLAGGGK